MLGNDSDSQAPEQLLVDRHLEAILASANPKKSLIRRSSSSSLLRKQLNQTSRHVVAIISAEALRIVDNRSQEEFACHFLPVC